MLLAIVGVAGARFRSLWLRVPYPNGAGRGRHRGGESRRAIPPLSPCLGVALQSGATIPPSPIPAPVLPMREDPDPWTYILLCEVAPVPGYAFTPMAVARMHARTPSYTGVHTHTRAPAQTHARARTRRTAPVPWVRRQPRTVHTRDTRPTQRIPGPLGTQPPEGRDLGVRHLGVGARPRTARAVQATFATLRPYARHRLQPPPWGPDGSQPSPQGLPGGPALFCADVLRLDGPAGPKPVLDSVMNTHACKRQCEGCGVVGEA